MSFHSARLSDLTEAEILALVGLPEGLQLEFKAQLNIETLQSRRELAKDWSAMANAEGGRVIYGLQEAETGEGSRVAAAITPLTDWSAVSRVADIVATLIQPQIRFDLRDVAVAGGFVLVVEIRASNGIDLHMAANPKGGRFYRRTTNGAVPMSEAEVRDAYFRIGELRASLDQRFETLTMSEVGRRQEANTSFLIVPLWSRPNLIEPIRYANLNRDLYLDVLKDFDLRNWAQSLRLQHDGYRYNGDGHIPEGLTVPRRYLSILKTGVVHRSDAWRDESPAHRRISPERLLVEVLETLVLGKYMLAAAGYRGGVRLHHRLRIPQWWSIYSHASEYNEPGTFKNDVSDFELESSPERWGLAIRELLDPYYHASRERECALIGRDGVILPKQAESFPVSFDRYLAIDRSASS